MSKIFSETMCKCGYLYGEHSKGDLFCPNNAVKFHKDRTFSPWDEPKDELNKNAMCFCGYTREKHSYRDLRCPTGSTALNSFHPTSTFKWNKLHKKDLGQQALELCWQIGKLGACYEQTQTELMACDLSDAINSHLEKELKEAQNLATSIWEQHYKNENPNWKPLSDTIGVLSQISNMVSGMSRVRESSHHCGTCQTGQEGCVEGSSCSLNGFNEWKPLKSKKVVKTKCACEKKDCPDCSPKARPMFDCYDSQSEPLNKSDSIEEKFKTPYDIAYECLEHIASGHISILPRYMAEEAISEIHEMTKPVQEGSIKFGKETEEVVHKFEIECDGLAEEIFIDYAKKRILNDKQALINYAVNEIIKEEMERQEHE